MSAVLEGYKGLEPENKDAQFDREIEEMMIADARYQSRKAMSQCILECRPVSYYIAK